MKVKFILCPFIVEITTKNEFQVNNTYVVLSDTYIDIYVPLMCIFVHIFVFRFDSHHNHHQVFLFVSDKIRAALSVENSNRMRTKKCICIFNNEFKYYNYILMKFIFLLSMSSLIKKNLKSWWNWNVHGMVTEIALTNLSNFLLNRWQKASVMMTQNRVAFNIVAATLGYVDLWQWNV